MFHVQDISLMSKQKGTLSKKNIQKLKMYLDAHVKSGSKKP